MESPEQNGPGWAGGPAQPYGQPPSAAGGHPPQHQQYGQPAAQPHYTPLSHPYPPQSPYPGLNQRDAPRRSSGGGLAVAAVIVVGVFALVAVGIFAFVAKRDSGTGIAGPPGQPRPVPAQSASTPVTGTWKGDYDCGQGVTALTLTITESRTGDGLEATFSFSADTSNPDVPSGSFAMRGDLTDGTLVLSGDHWIDQPDGYQMVGLTAQVPDPRPTRIEGTVNGSGCSRFSIERS